MLTPREDVRQRILDELDEWSGDIDDLLVSLADSECPVYYNAIIAEWTELSPADSNEFGEIMTPTEKTTIYELMSADLYLYYWNLFRAVYEEILEEQEEKAGA